MVRKRRTQRANLAYINQPPLQQNFGHNANQGPYQQNPQWQGGNVQYPPQTYAYPPYDPSTGFAPVSFKVLSMCCVWLLILRRLRSRTKAHLRRTIRPRMDRRLGTGRRLFDADSMLPLNFDPWVACCTLPSCLYCNCSHNGILFGTRGYLERRENALNVQRGHQVGIETETDYIETLILLECGDCCTWQRLLIGHVATVILLLHLTDDRLVLHIIPPTFFPRRCADRLSLS